MPVRNAAPFLDETLQSLLDQQQMDEIRVQISIYNDGSSASESRRSMHGVDCFSSAKQDETMALIERWRTKLDSKYQVIVNGHDDATARGGERPVPGGNGHCDEFSQWVTVKIERWNFHRADSSAFTMP